MDLVVAHDMTDHGDAALRAAIFLSNAEGGLGITVVHVLTQRDLDNTGELFTKEKQEAAIEKAYPAVWRRIDPVLEEDEAEDRVEVDVVVRLAPGHLVRSEAKIADVIVEVARGYGCSRVVLGRVGRPDSVAENLSKQGRLEPGPDLETDAGRHVRVLRLAEA